MKADARSGSRVTLRLPLAGLTGAVVAAAFAVAQTSAVVTAATARAAGARSSSAGGAARSEGMRGAASAYAERSLPALDHLAADWQALRGYSMTIDSHEVLGNRVSDHEIRYSFSKPHHAELDVMTGAKSGSTMIWDGGDTAFAYRRGLLSFVKIHGGVRDPALTSLRGNGVLSPDIGDLVECLEANRARLREGRGPTITGQATDILALPYAGVSCPDDSPADKSITLDVLYISRSTGLIVRRERYVGTKLVERFDLTDFKILASSAAKS